MVVEHARARALPKPWGVTDLSPWFKSDHDGDVIGEIWYERSDSADINPSLLLKLLFTSQPLSIQVHPDDAFARSMGLPNGKTEAWYVLSAAPDAKVALGLKRRLSPQQLRAAIDDGLISDLVVWCAVSAGDVISVPAGTIHAIGAGLVIAELQQRSDTTFRMFDPGRRRELHVENAILVADAGPADFQPRLTRLTPERTVLVSNVQFVFERVDLKPNSSWCLRAERETWILVLSGGAGAGSFQVAQGDALFAHSDHVDIHAGESGMVGLVAYTGGGAIPHLLQRIAPRHRSMPRANEIRVPTSPTRTKAATKNSRLEPIK